MEPQAILEEITVKIKEAREVLRGVVHVTPLVSNKTFSDISGGEVYLKLENLQKTGAFKVRGAFYKISKLVKTKDVKKVVTASSGNHAQGVAYSASLLGVEAVVVMPRYTPFYKVNAARSYGAKVILHGETYDDAYLYASDIAQREAAPFIHPFDDPDIIAGQGTIGVEIYEQLPDADLVLVPVGGGGLIAGIAIALKRLSSRVKVIGVQPRGAPAMYMSYERGEVVETPQVFSIADGVVVKKPGKLTFSIIQELVDDSSPCRRERHSQSRIYAARAG